MKHPADATRLARRGRTQEAVEQLKEAADWLAQLDQAINDTTAWRRQALTLALS